MRPVDERLRQAEPATTAGAEHKVRQRVRDRMEALIARQIREEDEV